MKISRIALILIALVLMSGCAGIVPPQKTTIPTVEVMEEKSVPEIEGYIALTFDDGPHEEITPQILDLLETHDVKATFFVVGWRVTGNEEILKRMVRGGNEVGNHSWSHPDILKLPRWKVEKELLDCQEAIISCIGYGARLFRPPYGSYDRSARSKGIMNMSFALWTLDTLDWKDRDANIVVERVMRGTIDRSIILLHDIHLTTLEAARIFIPKLKERGFVFVTMSELSEL